MAEAIISPGVFQNEIDQSFLPAGAPNIGAALIGPTVKGPAMIPTIINSYSDFQAKFGDVFDSGSNSYQYLTSHTAYEYIKNGGDTLTVIRILAGEYSKASGSIPIYGETEEDAYATTDSASFYLYTHADGELQNSKSTQGINALLPSGSKDNLRWEVTNVNNGKGTFTLLIRRGNDTSKRKGVLETWNNVSLDPKSSNFLAKVVGDQTYNLVDSGETTPYLSITGSYPNNSNYVRVVMNKLTPDYLDENGTVRIPAASASLPAAANGTFDGGSDGNIKHPQMFYENITNNNTQGYNLAVEESGSISYQDAIYMLANKDEYNINMLLTPGIISENSDHSNIAQLAIDMCESRGDVFYILDLANYGTALTSVTSEAGNRDTSYAGAYWPWVAIRDIYLNKSAWVPASVPMAGIFAFNDKVAEPWFAPAGLNRGGITSAVMAERKLQQANRDSLYDRNVNPIASFPQVGIAAWGQKTLQKKASAMDRINVRRLLIAAKKFVGQNCRNFVFSNNTTQTRANLLNTLNPWFERVQQKQGVYKFLVIVDETNNTNEVIDRNELKAQIYLQPAKAAEFILVDFIVTSTGAEFGQ